MRHKNAANEYTIAQLKNTLTTRPVLANTDQTPTTADQPTPVEFIPPTPVEVMNEPSIASDNVYTQPRDFDDHTVALETLDIAHECFNEAVTTYCLCVYSTVLAQFVWRWEFRPCSAGSAANSSHYRKQQTKRVIKQLIHMHPTSIVRCLRANRYMPSVDRRFPIRLSKLLSCCASRSCSSRLSRQHCSINAYN